MMAVSSTIVTTIIGLAIGVITFFLKRTISDLDCKASKKDLEKVWDSIASLQSDVKTIKQDYITKEDFFREQAKTDRKLDRIMDILLEMKGEPDAIYAITL